jgi:hypothetical protein
MFIFYCTECTLDDMFNEPPRNSMMREVRDELRVKLLASAEASPSPILFPEYT